MFITKCGDCHCWRYLGEVPGQKGLTYGHCKLFPDRDGKLERKDDDYCGIIAYLEAMKTLLDQIKVNTARMLIDPETIYGEKKDAGKTGEVCQEGQGEEPRQTEKQTSKPLGGVRRKYRRKTTSKKKKSTEVKKA